MPNFGEALKRERELREITLREISEATKINLRYLDALEHNEFDDLPGGVFNRGFVRAYAQYIGADPDALVNAYLLESQEQTNPGGSQALLRRMAEARELEGSTSTPGGGRRASTRVVVVGASIVVGLLAVAALWYGFGQRAVGKTSAAEDGNTAEATPTATASVAGGSATSTDGIDAGAAPGATPIEENDDAVATAENAAPVESEPVQEPPTSVAKRTPPPARVPESEPTATIETTASNADAAPEPTTTPPKTTDALIQARVVIERETTGRLNCDGRQVEMLDGMPPGTALEMECRSYLVLDADDGGGVRLGLAGATPVALVADGVPLREPRHEPGREPRSDPDRENPRGQRPRERPRRGRPRRPAAPPDRPDPAVRDPASGSRGEHPRRRRGEPGRDDRRGNP
jgi:cytoskeletal protein RodZ